MLKLLRAGIYRMFKERFFWILIAITVSFSFLTMFLILDGHNFNVSSFDGDLAAAYEQNFLFDDPVPHNIRATGTIMTTGTAFVIFISAVFTVSHNGSLFKEGTVRNMVGVGHSRISVYLSSLIISSVAAVIFFVISLISLYVFSLLQGVRLIIYPRYVIPMLLSLLMTVIAMTSVFTFLAFTVKKEMIAMVISLVIIPVMMSYPSMLMNGIAGHVLTGYDMPDFPVGDHEIVSLFDDEEYRSILAKNGMELKTSGPPEAPDPVEKGTILLIKTSPVGYVMEYEAFTMNPYVFVEGGSASRYALVSLIWFTVISFAGGILISRKDII